MPPLNLTTHLIKSYEQKLKWWRWSHSWSSSFNLPWCLTLFLWFTYKYIIINGTPSLFSYQIPLHLFLLMSLQSFGWNNTLIKNLFRDFKDQFMSILLPSRPNKRISRVLNFFSLFTVFVLPQKLNELTFFPCNKWTHKMFKNLVYRTS